MAYAAVMASGLVLVLLGVGAVVAVGLVVAAVVLVVALVTRPRRSGQA